MAVADDITAGVAALIDGEGYAGVVVRDRKQPAATELDAAVTTLINVWVIEDGSEFETADDDVGRAGRYRLGVGISRRNSGDGLSGATNIRTLRQDITRLLTGSPGLPGTVPAVDWVDTITTPQFDTGLLDAGWDESWLWFEVKTREPRN